jgi:hypothetical protein
MRKGVLVEGAQGPRNAREPNRGFRNLTLSSDDLRALLALGLAAGLLSVYTLAWATGAVSI